MFTYKMYACNICSAGMEQRAAFSLPLDHGTRVPAGVTRVGTVKAGSEYRPCLIITYSHTDSDIITHILFVQDIFSICRCV